MKAVAKPYNINSNGLCECPECGSLFGKVYNIFNDNLYSLQCPNYREHCNRKNSVPEYEANLYKEIKYIKRCPICKVVLSYDNSLHLVCPNNPSHLTEIIKISQDDIKKFGYLSNF